MSISFEQFKSQVIDDLGDEYKPSMDSVFRDFDREQGRGGFQFSCSVVWRAYAYSQDNDQQWLYCGGRGSQGRGSTLEAAQAEEERNYSADFNARL